MRPLRATRPERLEPDTTMRTSLLPLALALTLGSALLDAALTPAHAALGDTVASVHADQAKLRGALRVKAEAGYSVQEITAASGTIVREYISPAGVVFAVSWQGPVVPDLRQLLGRYFAQARSAAAVAPPHGHSRLEVRQPGLVVSTGGHLRDFFGIAYVPDLLPRGFPLSTVH